MDICTLAEYPLGQIPVREFLYSKSHRHNPLHTADISAVLPPKLRPVTRLDHPNTRRLDLQDNVSRRKCEAPVGACVPRTHEFKRWADDHGNTGSLTTADIQGAQTCQPRAAGSSCGKMDRNPAAARKQMWWSSCSPPLSTQRIVDNLNPVYKLPCWRSGPVLPSWSAGTHPLPNPRKIGDCSDITGACTSIGYMKRRQRVSTFLRNDIAVRFPRRAVRDNRNPLDVRDINTVPISESDTFRTTRVGQPLDPRYDWDRPTSVEPGAKPIAKRAQTPFAPHQQEW
eukprot:TRINITY_DN8137_c0_g1_i3.p1 TRINITY_DN8137_c0_g1~~TRINITY_DN8137_c0_g1_i3.p1  ORF type:complete len:284 (-),score=-3.30 TRINITY_DN8137_c0_g1_i3:166-1017(-)